MKKIYLAMMCMAGLTMMTACGGEKKTGEPVSAEEAVEAAVEASAEMSGVDKCAATLESVWGIKIAQVQPDFEYAEVTEGWDKFQSNGVNNAYAVYKKKDGSAISKEEFRAWAEKIYALTKSLSAEGKNIRGYDGISKLTEEQANAEVSLDDIMLDDFQACWSFRTDKGMQRCMVTHQGDKDPNYMILGLAPGLTGNLE